MHSNPVRYTRAQLIRELFRARLIACSLCRIHRGENSNGRRKRTDIHKNRDTARSIKYRIQER